MLSFFNKTIPPSAYIRADIHSHLLPRLDDGVKSLEESYQIITNFQALGYVKLITTPHVMSDSYPNTPAIIRESLQSLRAFLVEKNNDMMIDAGAEYYFDEHFIEMVEKQEPLMTWGRQYLLFETNYISEPYQFKDIMFKLITHGYSPVLAHPERYQYMTMEKAEDLHDRGVLLQLNALSVTGTYSNKVRNLAYKMIDHGLIDFVGSDCHHMGHITELKKAFNHKYFKKLLNLPLLNNSLI